MSDTQESVDVYVFGGGSLTVNPGGSYSNSAGTIIGSDDAGSNPDGTWIIEGTASLSTPLLNFDFASAGDGTLEVRPTENGLAGLTPIDVTFDLLLNSDSQLTFSDSLYTPVVDDSWVIINTPSVTGTFENI